MLSASDVHKALYALQALNLNFQVQGQADFWTPVLNEAAPDMTAAELKAAVNRLAASRDTNVRQGRITPADILDSLDQIRLGDKKLRQERLAEARRLHGDFTIHQDVSDPEEYLRFKRVAIEAFHAGATPEQASAAAWQAIGRSAPQIEATTKVTANLGQIGRNIK